MASNKCYQAVVARIFPNGRHGAYALAISDRLGPITFSLSPPVWQEKDWPETGTCVMLSEFRKKSAGWRAQHGRYFVPSDEENRKEKEE